MVVYKLLIKLFNKRRTGESLSIEGGSQKVVFNNQQYQLKQTSRVAFYGCYIIVGQKKQLLVDGLTFADRFLQYFYSLYQQRLIFVDRRSLTAKQFSTLCFIIKWAQQGEHE